MYLTVERFTVIFSILAGRGTPRISWTSYFCFKSCPKEKPRRARSHACYDKNAFSTCNQYTEKVVDNIIKSEREWKQKTL